VRVVEPYLLNEVAPGQPSLTGHLRLQLDHHHGDGNLRSNRWARASGLNQLGTVKENSGLVPCLGWPKR
jgi:hypothetical protein